MNSAYTSISYAKMFLFSNFLHTGLLIADNFIGQFGTKVDVQDEALLTKKVKILHFSGNNLVKY